MAFLHDFDLPRSITPEDLTEIEARMRRSSARVKLSLRQEITAGRLRKLFKDQPI
jgi:threonyl-tRNA synthetase